MRHVIVAALALAAAGCVSRPASPIATTPSVAIRPDSTRVMSKRDSTLTKLLSDSLLYRNMRRQIDSLDSLLVDALRAKPKP
jgi:hypothetical protein